MDFIIGFFRDVLDGPLYIIVAIICVILICSCIGYLAEQSLKKKKQKQEYDETHATVNNTSQVAENSVQPTTNNLESVAPIEVTNQPVVGQEVGQVPTTQPMAGQMVQSQVPQNVVGVPNVMNEQTAPMQQQVQQPIPDVNSGMMVSPDQINSVLGSSSSIPSVPSNLPQDIMPPIGTEPTPPNVVNTPPTGQ